MSLVPEWLWWLVVAVFAVGLVAVYEVPLAAVRDVLPRSRRRRTARRVHLRRVGGRGWLPGAAERSGPLELDARGPVEHRVAIDAPELPRQQVPEYVPRDIDPLVRSAIDGGGLVVLEGPAASGKTRSAHAALGASTGRRLIVPAGPASLTELVRAGEVPRGAVIWLDDLERYLDPPDGDGLDLPTLERLCPPGRTDVTVLATLRGVERETLPAERATPILGRATVIAIPLGWSAGEFFRAEETDDPLLAAAMANRHGLQITEYLAAAPETYARWRGARDGRQSIAGALITAAVDARRCGHPGPVPRDLLVALAPHYLAPHELLRWDTDAALDDALAWSTASVRGNTGCLIPSYGDAGQECYEPFAHLVTGYGVDSAAGVPDPVWELLADRTPVPDVLAFAREAQSDGRATVAERVLAGSLVAHPTDVELMAALGSVLSADPMRQAEAERWLLPAAEDGHSDAMESLGRLLANDAKRTEESERWLRLASEKSRFADEPASGPGLGPGTGPGSDPNDDPGWLDAAMAAERSALSKWLARVFPSDTSAGERVRRTEEWLADRLRRRHLDVVDPEAIGPDWLPAPWLDRVSGQGLRAGAGFVEAGLAMTLVVVALITGAAKAADTLAMPPWQAATAWLLLAAAVLMGAVRAFLRARALAGGRSGARFEAWGVRTAGWRWWVGELGWLVAGVYGWVAAYLAALLVGGDSGRVWLVLGLAALIVTAPYAIDRGTRKAVRAWQPVADRPEPFAPLYAGVRGAVVIAGVSGGCTLVATGALGLLAVQIVGSPTVAAVWPMLAVVAAVGSFLHNGGLVWIRHLATRLGAWRRGMSLGRRFFDDATERGTLVRVQSGYAFADAGARRELARAYRASRPA